MESNYIKYPRTFHLPYSLSKTDDDKTLESDDHFKKMKEVVVTIKMDGENTTIYPDGYMHARSLDGNGKPWQKEVKSLSSEWFWKIPDGYRICGENLQAKHSITYTFNDRKELFQVFGIYDVNNYCVCWDELEEMCGYLKINHVPVIYRGKYDKDLILEAFNEYCSKVAPQEVEGFVVRNADRFKYEDFSKNVGKFVRKNHVQTDEHWTKKWVNNIIKKIVNNE